MDLATNQRFRQAILISFRYPDSMFSRVALGPGHAAPVAIVLGGGGRLGPFVVSSLEHRGFRVVSASRRASHLIGIDVCDTRWKSADHWKVTLESIGVAPGDVRLVVNLIASERRSVETGRGSIAATLAVSSVASGVRSIHIGSVAENRAGRLSAYAAGKVAARAAAVAAGVDVVLTLGVVPRPVGHHSDAMLRWFVERIPMVATIQIDVTTCASVGAAVGVVASIPLRNKGTLGVTLAGRARTLAEVLGVETRRRLYSAILLNVLALCPRTRATRWARVVSFARQAVNRSPGHYSTEPLPTTACRRMAGRFAIYDTGDDQAMWLVARDDVAA